VVAVVVVVVVPTAATFTRAMATWRGELQENQGKKSKRTSNWSVGALVVVAVGSW